MQSYFVELCQMRNYGVIAEFSRDYRAMKKYHASRDGGKPQITETMAIVTTDTGKLL